MTITDAEVERLTDQQITDLLREASDSRDIRFRPFRHFFVMALRELQSSRAASQARALSSGEGWVLVPVEPTSEMRLAGCAELDRNGRSAQVAEIYRAMLAARPQPAPDGSWPDWCPQRGTHFTIEHDGFAGKVIGWYQRDDGAQGTVLQLDNAKVVHVYGIKWLRPQPPSKDNTNE